MKALRDQRTNLEAAERKGREEGELIGKIRLVQELLGDPVSTSEELASWDLDRLKQLAVSLQSRLRGRI